MDWGDREEREEEEEKEKRGCGRSLAIFLFLAVLAVLAVLIPPAIDAFPKAAQCLECVNNMKGLALAIRNFTEVNGAAPPAFTFDETGKPLHSWRVAILPYIRENELYQKIRHDEPWDSEWNSQFHDQMPAMFACPSAPLEAGKTTYAAVVDKEGALRPGYYKHPGYRGVKPEEIADGAENTICLIERRAFVCWMNPMCEVSLETLAEMFGGGHAGGVNAIMFDGSVRQIKRDIEPETLRALATAAGGEAVDVDAVARKIAGPPASSSRNAGARNRRSGEKF